MLLGERELREKGLKSGDSLEQRMKGRGIEET